MNLLLKLIAGLVGLLILSLIVAKTAGFAIGVRTGQNLFTEVNVSLWLVGPLFLIELVVVALLVFSSKTRV